jgi:sterol desaturase/sphingolipid hydroxylase (fatty acid hydroxylase superfamily)
MVCDVGGGRVRRTDGAPPRAAGGASSGSRRVPGWLSGGLVLGAFAVLVVAEARRPLRRPEAEPKPRRDLRNLAVAALSAATLRALEKPVVEPLSRAVERRRRGLLQWLAPPRWLELPLAVALMDYTLYLWHALTHRVPFLWRLHAVHHVDLDLSATTALRFHFAEMAVSVPYRAAQVALLGVGPRALSVWQTFLFASILFHHSNLRLPLGLERRLVPFLVTPRMHGIHHSIVEEEANSNWSSGFTLWDRLHGTLRLDVPQDRVTVGLPAYRDPDEVTLAKILAMPFARQRPSFLLPDGRRPRRGRRPPPGLLPG